LQNRTGCPSAARAFRSFWESADKRWNIYIEGRNLLNQNYIATYNVIPDADGHDGRDFYPGEGRAVYAGFRWKL
jgi:outer membrane receptor protein involved in Fe transport